MKRILLLTVICCLLLIVSGCAASQEDQLTALEEAIAAASDSDPLQPIIIRNAAGVLDYDQVNKDADISDGSPAAIANRYIYRQLARYASGYYGNTINGELEYTNPCDFTDVRINTFEQAAVYDDLLPEETVYVYHLDYSLQPNRAEDIVLRDAMYFDDEGWLADRGGLGSPYLILIPSGNDGQYRLLTAMDITYYDATGPLEASVKMVLVELGLIPATSAEQAAEFSFLVGGQALTLGQQEGSFPWGYALTEVSRENGDGDGFHWIDIDTAEGLQLSAFRGANDDDTDAYLYSMYTESADFATYRGVRCGDSEDELQAAYGEELTHNDYTYEFNPALDSVWRVIVFQVMDGQIFSINILEIVD